MITLARLQETLDYDAATGVFIWRAPTSNRVSAGAIAGSPISGYVEISIDNRAYRAHRLAWLFVHHRMPVGQLDHINGHRADNRIANLREAQPFQNNGNMKRPKHNRSGVKGVFWDAGRKRWHAQIQIDGRSKCLGRYVDIRDAQLAYEQAARARFGEFARMS